MVNAYLNRLLGDQEEILLITRRHWIVLLENILVEIILSMVAVAIITIVWIFNAHERQIGLAYLILIFPMVSLARDVLIWSKHTYVITNLRVIQVMGIINKSVIDSSLEKVNDVKMDQSVIGRLLNFGDLEILTASELGVNRFTRIGDPVRFKTTLLNAKVRLEQNEVVIHHTSSPAADVPALIEQLGTLRDKGLLTEDEFQEKKTRLLAQL